VVSTDEVEVIGFGWFVVVYVDAFGVVVVEGKFVVVLRVV